MGEYNISCKFEYCLMKAKKICTDHFKTVLSFVLGHAKYQHGSLLFTRIFGLKNMYDFFLKKLQCGVYNEL